MHLWTGFLTSLFLLVLPGTLPCSSGHAKSPCRATAYLQVVGNSAPAAGCTTSVPQEPYYNCGSLQSALEFMSASDTTDQNCTVLVISPGLHTLTRNISIRRSVLIRGNNSLVNFVIDKQLLEALTHVDPIAVLSFEDSLYVSIEGVRFSGSPGFIQLENVTDVSLIKSTFR